MGTESTTEGTEKYQAKIELLSRELRKALNRAEKLEDAILLYVAEADRTGTMNPKNLNILRDTITRDK